MLTPKSEPKPQRPVDDHPQVDEERRARNVPAPQEHVSNGEAAKEENESTGRRDAENP